MSRKRKDARMDAVDPMLGLDDGCQDLAPLLGGDPVEGDLGSPKTERSRSGTGRRSGDGATTG